MNTILNVSGMTCGNCVKHVTAALSALPGVQRADVKLHEGRAEITHDATTSVESLLEAVRAEGYEAALA
jgi:copper chaperone CopZ